MTCLQCGFLNQDGGWFCNNCGIPAPVPQKPKQGNTWKVVLVIFAVMFGLVFLSSLSRLVPDRPRQAAQSPSAPAVSPPAKPTAVVTAEPTEEESEWRYGESSDAMTSQTIKTASVVSANTVAFDFPYQGEQHATLILRKRRGVEDVMLSIEKGQLTCGGYGQRGVSVRFDQKPARRFSVTEPADHSSTDVFINNEKAFIAEAKKASAIRIEAIVYQNGAPVFHFPTAGLKW